MDYYQRQRMAAFKRDMERQSQDRLRMIETYSQWHPREWLESLSYAELVAWRNAGRLDRPTLPKV